MIPVTLMKIEGQHSVLDMCAAPGSKTVQILEALHKENAYPTGFVVANEIDER
jgi:multisite-specific tRNA:(cytosine-C5)-methyltransferase